MKLELNFEHKQTVLKMNGQTIALFGPAAKRLAITAARAAREALRVAGLEVEFWMNGAKTEL